MLLIDSHHRTINYLRLSLLDSCNFRCQYCLPELFNPFSPQKEWLTVPEIKLLVDVLTDLGVNKIRLTGGEPTLRKDFFQIAETIHKNKAVDSLHLTTNASWKTNEFSHSIHKYFTGVNVSLDSLNSKIFEQITQTDYFETVWNNILCLYNLGTPIKLNVVVMKGINDAELIKFVELTQEYNFEVRFLEAMPFDGKKKTSSYYFISAKEIYNTLSLHYQDAILPINQEKSSTSDSYKIKDYKGKWGIIPAFSRTFCGDCNRIRITAKGEWINCLYQNKGLNVRRLMRAGISSAELKSQMIDWVKHKPKDGFEAEKNNQKMPLGSMSAIGG